MKYIDTHTHIYTEEFATDRHDVVSRAKATGAAALLLPNIDEQSIADMNACCQQYPGFCFPMMGLHPTELPPNPEAALNHMEDLLKAPGNPYIAVGEVGVDLYWDSSRREEQMSVFERQAGWAASLNLPLIIHSRNAQSEIFEVLEPLKDRLHGGIFHCFGGNAEEAAQLLNFDGFCLGIGGVVTFKKSTLPDVLKTSVPLSRIVLETDAPYLAPTPHRGKRNEPSYIPLVIDKLAEIYDKSPEEIANQTTQNALNIFGKLPRHLASNTDR